MDKTVLNDENKNRWDVTMLPPFLSPKEDWCITVAIYVKLVVSTKLLLPIRICCTYLGILWVYEK